jgi:integrase
MAENKLSARKVATIKTPGRIGDGGGLYLETRIGTDGTRHQSWLFRYKIAGRPREMGLGTLTASNGLIEARAERNRWRTVLREGRDPIEVRKAEAHAKLLVDTGTQTVTKAFEDYLAANRGTWRSPATEIDWLGQFESHVLPVIGRLAVADVAPGHIDRILEPLWGGPVRGLLLRQRLEAVLDRAIARGYRTTENPARLRRVKGVLNRRPKHKKTHMAAMDLEMIAGFIAKLRERQAADPIDPSPWALEFLILTGVRANQVRMARWKEIDLSTATWVSPGAEWDAKGELAFRGNTKSGRPHRVALSDRAVAILRAQPGGHNPDDFIFSGSKGGAPLGRNTLRIWGRQQLGMTVTLHGFRSTFRDWVATKTRFPRELPEFQLDHAEAVGDATERAYLRDDLLEKRRPMMAAWARFLDRPVMGDNVTALPVKAA